MKDSLWYEVEQVQPMQRHLLLILLIYRLCCVLEFLLRRKSPVFFSSEVVLQLLLCSPPGLEMLFIFLFMWELLFAHPFPLVPCLKYFLANSNMSYWLSCSALSSRSPSAKPSRETLWRFKKQTAPCYGVTFTMRWTHRRNAPLWSGQFRAPPWWTPRRRPRPRTPRTDPLLPSAQPFGPAAATGSPGRRWGGRTQPGRSRSGWTQRRTSSLAHGAKRSGGKSPVIPDELCGLTLTALRLPFAICPWTKSRAGASFKHVRSLSTQLTRAGSAPVMCW